MASSIELRLPLVDHRLVEVVIGHRKTTPDHHLAAKTWLKDAVKDLLPPEVMERPKRGFSPETAKWYQALMARYGHLIEGGLLVESGVLTPEAGRQLAAGQWLSEGVASLPFKALCLEVWYRQMRGERMQIKAQAARL